MRWNRRMFHTKARSHEGGWLVAPTTLVALGKRVWCLATFVDLVSHCPSHDSLRESQGNSATKPGVTPSAALPRVWSESAPQPRSGLCPTAHGCAAEALLWVTAQHINSPERVVPSHHQGRLSAGARIRQNGERHGWFSVSQATLNRVIHKLDASAQPRWGCLCLWPLPGVAPPRRNPGLHGRIPLGFPEGDGATCDLRIHGGKTAIARPWAFPDGGIGPRPFTPIPSTSIRGSPPPTPRALWHTARGCAAEALPRVQATSRSLPRKGLRRSCPPGGSGKQGRNGIRFAGAEEEPARNVCPISPKYTHLTYNPFEPSAQPRWGREWCVWVGVDRFAAMDGGQRRWRCSAIVAHTRGNAGLWGRTLSAFPEGEEGPIHPEIHRIIPQNPTRGRRA
jgi:hypothetical protein